MVVASLANLAICVALAVPVETRPLPPAASELLTILDREVFENAPTDGDEKVPTVLSLEAALALFERRGFDLLLAEATIEAARGDTQVAGALPNPQLAGSIGYSPDGAKSPTPSALALQALLSDQTAIEDALSGKRGLRQAVARAALQATQYQRDDARRTLGYLLKQQYLFVALDEMALQFAEQMQTKYQSTVHLLELRYANGDVSEADLARIDVVACAGDQAYAAAVGQLATDKVLLAFMLGMRGLPQAFSVPTAWLEREDHHFSNASLHNLLQEAVRRRPDLAAQAHQVERAKQSIDLGYRLRFPDIAVDVAYQGQGDGPNAVQPATYSMGVTLTLPALYQFQGEITKARADYSAQTLLMSKAQGQLTNDVATAFVALKTCREVVAHMQGRMLVRAQRALELVGIQYSKGATSLLDLLDAQRNYVSTQQMYFANLQALWTAVFQMEQAVGKDS